MATILVIDDSVSLLEMFRHMLTALGHEVVATESSKEGIEILRNRPVDLLLTDIFMPDQDGLETIQMARRIKPGVGIIAMSSKTGAMDMLPAARAFGAALSLHKPFSVAALRDAVRQVLDAGSPTSVPPEAKR
jgi:CheY-like chemotaxis protein